MTNQSSMPGREGTEPRLGDAAATCVHEPGGASAHSRRLFLAGAGAGVAAAATAGVVTSSASAATAGPAGGGEAAQGGRAIVAYVSDVSGGQISLLQGEQEVVVRDRALAQALAQRFDRGVSAGQARTTTTEEL